MIIHNCTTPDWKPLERAIRLANLPAETTGHFMWMCEQPAGVHQYKHRLTRSYIRLRGTETAPACERDIATALGRCGIIHLNQRAVGTPGGAR